MSEDLCYLTATELAARYRDKTLSPVEVMRVLIEHANKVEPVVNALSHRFSDEALEQAKQAEARFAAGNPSGPLDGIPVAIKDETMLAGKPCTNGCIALKDFVPDFNSIENQRLIDAGAIIHARSTTPEFSCAGYTHSPLHGVTRNPWNPDFTPGGSSGGACASLAAGTTPLASGSDIAGSIRIPASCSGVVGFKPPYGRNAMEYPFNLDTYCHSGPIARSVSDVILMQNVVSGPHPQDIAAIRPRLELPSDYPPIDGWKIAWSPDLGGGPVDPAVAANLQEMLDVLRSLGASVEEVVIDWPADALEAAKSHLTHFWGQYILNYHDQYAEVMSPYATALVVEARQSTAEKYFRSVEAAGEMYAQFGAMMENYQLFVCPTTRIPAVAADNDFSRDRLEINGVEVDPWIGWIMTWPFNMLSRCPVMSVPSGFGSNGVPTGIQLVGKALDDLPVMQAAMALETALGGWYREPASRPSMTGISEPGMA